MEVMENIMLLGQLSFWRPVVMKSRKGQNLCIELEEVFCSWTKGELQVKFFR